MHAPDDYVVTLHYRDRFGNETHRVLSPIRFVGGNRFLALCLSKEEPRQFCIERCSGIEIQPAHHFMMPLEENWQACLN